LALVIVALVVALVLGAYGLVFVKAGQPFWAAFVPVYNTVVMARISGRPWWHGLIWVVPLATLPFAFILPIDLARTFGRSTAFGVGMVLCGFVFVPWLALGKDRYFGPLYAET